MEATLSYPYGVRGRNDIIYPAPDVAYTDDLNTISASCVVGLQAQADTVSAFTAFFGLYKLPSITILGLTLDLDPLQTTQVQSTRAHLTQASTILGYQRVTNGHSRTRRLNQHDG